MFERFTDHARATVTVAQQESHDLAHAHIGTEHLLLGLLGAEGSAAHRVLTAAGFTVEGVRAEVRRAISAPKPILTDEDAAALRTVGIDVDAVVARIEESFGPGALADHQHKRQRGLFGKRRGGGRFTPRSRKVLELSLREALRLKDKHIGTEHILLGLIREGGGLAAQIIVGAGVSLQDLRHDTLAAMGKAA